jgi:hypothetical protein
LPGAVRTRIDETASKSAPPNSRSNALIALVTHDWAMIAQSTTKAHWGSR